jgi:hypothetical protein
METSCDDPPTTCIPCDNPPATYEGETGGAAIDTRPICCFLLKFGSCVPPRGTCKFRHAEDDGLPCCFGAACRLGHKNRVAEKAKYWEDKHSDGGLIGSSPAVRDATLLRSQLEPWPTSVLRDRLVTSFGFQYEQVDALERPAVMEKLLASYAEGKERTIVKVDGTPVRSALADQLLDEVQKWEKTHKWNNRPSINASSYMILRSPAEFSTKDSTKAKQVRGL